MSITNAIKLYRACNINFTHINKIENLSNNVVLFLCRNPLEWFPDHLDRKDYAIYEFVIKYSKNMVFNEYSSNLYFDSFDYVSLVETKKTNLFKLDDKIIPNEEGGYHILSSYGESLYRQGYDLLELSKPKNIDGLKDELEELIVLKPKDQVISILRVDHLFLK